jgi:hypothetical protein
MKISAGSGSGLGRLQKSIDTGSILKSQRKKMAKKSNPYGTGLFYKRTKKKRPGRHSKSPNKSFDKKKYNGQGRV